jgi:hypothetical protein
MKKLLVTLLAGLFLTGCGETISTKQIESKGIVVTQDESKANVILFRLPRALSGGVRVSINGDPIGYLNAGDHIGLSMPEGTQNIAVDLPATLGKCDVNINVSNAKPTYVEVKQKSLANSLIFGGIIGSEIGSAVESGRNTCTGSFFINPVTVEDGKKGIEATQKSYFKGFSLIQ